MQCSGAGYEESSAWFVWKWPLSRMTYPTCDTTVKLLESKKHKLNINETCAPEKYYTVYRITAVCCVISQKRTELETWNHTKFGDFCIYGGPCCIIYYFLHVLATPSWRHITCGFNESCVSACLVIAGECWIEVIILFDTVNAVIIFFGFRGFRKRRQCMTHYVPTMQQASSSHYTSNPNIYP